MREYPQSMSNLASTKNISFQFFKQFSVFLPVWTDSCLFFVADLVCGFLAVSCIWFQISSSFWFFFDQLSLSVGYFWVPETILILTSWFSFITSVILGMWIHLGSCPMFFGIWTTFILNRITWLLFFGKIYLILRADLITCFIFLHWWM